MVKKIAKNYILIKKVKHHEQKLTIVKIIYFLYNFDYLKNLGVIIWMMFLIFEPILINCVNIDRVLFLFPSVF